MKNIKFEDNEVLVNGNKYGELEFDKDQEAWVLYPESIDDGVTYYEDLKETQEEIKFELSND